MYCKFIKMITNIVNREASLVIITLSFILLQCDAAEMSFKCMMFCLPIFHIMPKCIVDMQFAA